MASTHDDPTDDQVPAEMPPEVARLLYPHRTRESSRVTVVFPELPDGVPEEVRQRVDELAQRATEQETRADPRFPLEDSVRVVHFGLDRVEPLHSLHETLAPIHGSERVRVLINDAEVPLATELWLPLLWTLLP